MLNSFIRYIAENNLLKPEDRILIAVSGGIDSMVMAHLFLHIGNEFGVAHCNFSLRGQESDRDNELVSNWAAERNIPFFSERFDTMAFAKMNGISIQMAARELRYDWFEETRKLNGYDLVAVAHNLNDNIETLLINLTRGTGISGLTGMRPAINRIIRPLLFATRDEITKYCNQHNIIFREDRSNIDTKYIRNKIRHHIIPQLKAINPSIEFTLNETAERFMGISDIVADHISRIRREVSEEEGGLITFNIKRLKEHSMNKTILFELFKPFGINNLQLNDLVSVIDGKTGGQIFTDTHRIIKNRLDLIVSHEFTGDENAVIIKNLEALSEVPEISSAEYFELPETFEIPSDPFIACVDPEKISFPLIIRRWKAGDFFYPLGMKQKKKLSDYFIDNKYSRLDKEHKRILESNGKIVWIIGERIDNRFRITKSTKRALLIKSTKKALVIKPLR